MFPRILSLIFAWAFSVVSVYASGLMVEHPPDAAGVTYFWKVAPVGNTAELVTLFCRSCGPAGASSGEPNSPASETPLVSVLRDNLGDTVRENDRLTSVWLLGYVRPTLTQRALSAVPFFYWRIGGNLAKPGKADTKPLLDLTSLQSPSVSALNHEILQWTILDPAATPIRATSRAYQTNQTDHERLHLEEAISYLRSASALSDPAALTPQELNLVIARLELRKKLLGGFVNQHAAAQLGEEEKFSDERIRARNWELLRQCAEKTGIYFEPVDLAGSSQQYAMLWFPLSESAEPVGSKLKSVWKLLNIKNPWLDPRMRSGKSPGYLRAFDTSGSLLPDGAIGVKEMRLAPLGVYSLDYPKFPLLLIDFRDKLHVRWNAVTQRSINEVTSGVIGISHFTNWYYYVAADLYDFVASRHGSAMDQPARLDCYSQFRVKLAMDHNLDPALRGEMQARIDSLAMNPLEASPAQESEVAAARYRRLLDESQPGGRILARVDKDRRAELARDQASRSQTVRADILHEMSLGTYTKRVTPDAENAILVDRYRRAQSHLAFLDTLVERGLQPEVQYQPEHIQFAVAQLTALLPEIDSPGIRVHAETTLGRLQQLSKDQTLQAHCSQAVASIRRMRTPLSGDIAAQPAAIHVSHPQAASSLNGAAAFE